MGCRVWGVGFGVGGAPELVDHLPRELGVHPVQLGRQEPDFRVPRDQILGCHVTKFAPHKAVKLVFGGKLTFDERVVVHRVDPIQLGRQEPGSGPKVQVQYHSVVYAGFVPPKLEGTMRPNLHHIRP